MIDVHLDQAALNLPQDDFDFSLDYLGSKNVVRFDHVSTLNPPPIGRDHRMPPALPLVRRHLRIFVLHVLDVLPKAEIYLLFF